ncbi:MAG: inositol monophosphatase [Actinomycetaceae bacterium]|nr:inositol monophosphatase [Actinomycetaceae bacterium]MDU0970128.1 inositol monophosphatase [Actinomycetaceae bacterium]
MISLDPPALASLALAAATEAGGYIRSVFRTGMAVETKANAHDPVTEHDRHTEALIRQILSEAAPGSRVLGEEGGEEALPGTGAERVRWIVDPIDGTANFAAGLDYIATSIGVELDGKPVAGCVHLPISAETCWADDRTCYWRDPAGEDRPVHASRVSREIDALLTGYFPHRDPDPVKRTALFEDIATLAEHYGTVRSPGACARDLAHVAAGHVGVAVATSVKPWDVAAGFHLIRVAGGHVTTYPRGLTDLPEHLRPAFVASQATLDAVTAKRVMERAQSTWMGPLAH